MTTNIDLVGIIDFFGPYGNINNPFLQHIIIWKFITIFFQYIMDSANWRTSLQYHPKILQHDQINAHDACLVHRLYFLSFQEILHQAGS